MLASNPFSRPLWSFLIYTNATNVLIYFLKYPPKQVNSRATSFLCISSSCYLAKCHTSISSGPLGLSYFIYEVLGNKSTQPCNVIIKCLHNLTIEKNKIYKIVISPLYGRISNSKMWPILMQLMRTNAVFITLPLAAVVGFIGYNVESLISDKYTPYSSKYTMLLLGKRTES